MSTSYDIHCLTCSKEIPDWRDATKTVLDCENTGFSNEIRDGAVLEKLLVNARPALETLGMLLKEAWQFTITGCPLEQLCEFFGRHAGHDLEVRDEYGRSWAEVMESRRPNPEKS